MGALLGMVGQAGLGRLGDRTTRTAGVIHDVNRDDDERNKADTVPILGMKLAAVTSRRWWRT